MIALNPVTPRGLGRLLRERRSTRELLSHPLDREIVASALWHAAGETQGGHRVSPSARATYPVAVTLVAGAVAELDAGAYCYEPGGHTLELIAEGDHRPALARATLDADSWLPACPALLLASADTTHPPSALADQPAEHSRKFSWLEAGLLVQNVSLWAAEYGLGAVVIAGLDDARAGAVAKQILPPRHELLAILAIGELSAAE